MAATTISLSEKSQDVLHNNCISCSEMSQIAILVKDEIKIIEIKCDPRSASEEFSHISYRIPSSRELMDLDVDIKREPLISEQQKHREISVMSLDNTLWPKDPASPSVNMKGFCKVSWSKKGCDSHQRCLLASLQLDHKLMIYSLQQRNCETKMLVNLSNVLWKIRKKHWKRQTFSSSLKKFEEFKKRKFSMAFVCMDWSNIIYRGSQVKDVVRNEETFQTPKEQFDRKVLLASALRDGSILLWLINIPLISESDVTIATTFETDFSWPKVLSWLNLEQEIASEGLLAVGSLTGEIGLWLVSITSTDETTAAKTLSLWDEKDDIMIDNFCWMKHPIQPFQYFLVTNKGQHVIVFLLSAPTPGEVTLIDKCIEGSLHAFPSSGLCSDGKFTMSCSNDGSVMKVKPSFEESVLKLNLEVLEKHPAIGPSHRGCFFTPSGTYMGIVTWHFLTRKEQLEIQICGGEKAAFDSLTNVKVPLYLKSDSLEWVRSSNLKSNNLDFPTISPERDLQAWVEDENSEGILYRLQLKRYLLTFQATKVAHVAETTRQLKVFEDKINELETKLQECGEILMALHFSKVLEELEEKDVSEKTVQMIYFWLTTHQASVSGQRYVKDSVQDALTTSRSVMKTVNTATLFETCNLCGEKIQFQSLWKDSCSNGHTWKRCKLSLLLCQTTTRRCGWCQAKVTSPDENSSPWLVKLLSQRCIFCSSVFVT